MLKGLLLCMQTEAPVQCIMPTRQACRKLFTISSLSGDICAFSVQFFLWLVCVHSKLSKLLLMCIQIAAPVQCAVPAKQACNKCLTLFFALQSQLKHTDSRTYAMRYDHKQSMHKVIDAVQFAVLTVQTHTKCLTLCNAL